ncbi:MAG: hypothetical protein LQ338_003378 [Usnochroma carphineum]|nr:MAG: hypothetical protein LQ338_003378 [Usnochroma carphineum]
MTEVLGKRFKLQFRPGRNEALILTSGPLIPLGPDDDGEFGEFKPSKALPAERFVPHRREESVDFKPRIHTGASISTSNAKNSKGTLGIFVDVKVGPASSHTYGLSPGVHKCVLTCHHNIEPASDSPDYVAAHSSGFPLVFDQDANPSVVYPAITDVTQAIRNLTHNIAADERQLREHHSKGQLFTCKTSSKEELFGLLSQLQANRKSLRDCQNLQKNGPIGRVVLSSGVQPFNKSGCQLEKPDSKSTRTAGLRHPCTAHDHHLKDFALIKLATGTSYANTAPLVRPRWRYDSSQPHRNPADWWKGL